MTTGQSASDAAVVPRPELERAGAPRRRLRQDGRERRSSKRSECPALDHADRAPGAQLAAGELQPLYLVVGDDEYAKDEVAKAFQAAVPEDVAGVRLRALLGARYDRSRRRRELGAHAAVPRRSAGDRRDRAPRSGSAASARAATTRAGRRRRYGLGPDVLEAYFERPSRRRRSCSSPPTSTARFRVVKALLKQAVVVECWGLKDEKDPRGPRNRGAQPGRPAGRRPLQARRDDDRSRRALEPLLAHAGTDIAHPARRRRAADPLLPRPQDRHRSRTSTRSSAARRCSTRGASSTRSSAATRARRCARCGWSPRPARRRS